MSDKTQDFMDKEESSPELEKADALIQSLGRLGMNSLDLLRVTESDVLYMMNQMQFLQVVESTGAKAPLDEPELLTADSGWTVHHYGDAMSTSPGRYIFGGGYFSVSSDDDDDSGGGVVNPGKGTIVKQSFDSACELVRLAKEFGWGGILIVDGHPDMQRAAWVEAVRIGIRLEGYEPNIAAEKKRRRIVSPSIDRMKAVISMLGSAS